MKRVGFTYPSPAFAPLVVGLMVVDRQRPVNRELRGDNEAQFTDYQRLC
jgi:hypothetical protein